MKQESSQATEKLQKLLAKIGLSSRREIERWIIAGRVSINGQKAKLGDRTTMQAVIRVDGHCISFNTVKRNKPRVIIYHKPVGEICTRSDPEQRATVFDNLPYLRSQRWVAIGRLDINTSGLLIFTTDGELANRLMHPSYQIERIYAVRILGKVDNAMLSRLQEGVLLDDGMAKFDSIHDAGGEGSNHWYHVSLKEGRNREVKRLWEAEGVKVSRLIRINYGTLNLPRWLRPGKWADVKPEQLHSLAELVNLAPLTIDPSPVKAKSDPHKRRKSFIKTSS